MNVVDIVIVVVVLLAAIQGARVGAMVQVCAILGFLGGLFLGAILASVTVRWVHGPTARTAVALTTMVGVAFALGMVGRILGSSTRSIPGSPDRSTPGSGPSSP
jgi:uncharacterized membrane protein required for colicin V production